MPTASGRALSLADELESWIRLASRSAVDAFGERPETKCVEVNTDITMQDMEEWCQVEAEISQEGLEVSDEKDAGFLRTKPRARAHAGKPLPPLSQAEALQGRLRGIALEEQQLNEELANLKAQLKQEKAFNHQQNQAHQQQVRKLKQALNKQKKEAEAKEQQRRKEEAKVKQAKEESAREEAKLKQQLQQAVPFL
eukprot:g21683.t1